MSATVFAEVPPQPPGSAHAFVSADPAIVAAVELYRTGQFAKATDLLSGPSISDERAAEELLEVIRRMRREYSLSRAELLQKLRPSIPDVSEADLNRWIADGLVQCRTIDAAVCIFRREPGQILRFCKEAMDRRDAYLSKNPPTSGSSAEPAEPWTLANHLQAVIAAANAGPATSIVPIKTRVTYTLTVKPNQRNARKGSILRVWLPFPQEYGRQRDVKLLRSTPAQAFVSGSGVDGDPVTGVPQRTVYLQQPIDDPAQPVVLEIEFEFATSAFYPKLDDAIVKPVALPADSSYLIERPPHIVFTPELRSKVHEIVGTETNPLKKARRIFEWIDANLRWTPEEEYAVIPNLSMHGFMRGKGDCGVASLTFITMCRIAGVPARWQSGWTTNPVGWNMHDWSEIYIDPWGWIPVDASYGRQKSDDPAIRDFYFGHSDSHRLIVNLDYGQELSPAKKSFRSEPLDFQRGEVELDGRNLYFDDWDYEITFARD